MGLSRVIMVGLATLRVIETMKEVLPTIPPPSVKSIGAGVAAAAFVVLDGERDPARVFLTGAAAAGAASIMHDGQDAIRRYTDNQITRVVQQAGGRRGPLQ